MRRVQLRGLLLMVFVLQFHAVQDNLEAYCHDNSAWGPWRCPGIYGKCTDKLATRYKCPEGDCVEGSQCTSLPGFKVKPHISLITPADVF